MAIFKRTKIKIKKSLEEGVKEGVAKKPWPANRVFPFDDWASQNEKWSCFVAKSYVQRRWGKKGKRWRAKRKCWRVSGLHSKFASPV